MKKKKSLCLLIAWILGLAYVLYLVSYFAGANTNTADTTEAIGAGLATMMVAPHMVVTLLAVIFNILGWAMNKRGFALTGGILYAVAMVLFIPYLVFVLVQMILSFVGFARLKGINERNREIAVKPSKPAAADEVGEIKINYSTHK